MKTPQPFSPHAPTLVLIVRHKKAQATHKNTGSHFAFLRRLSNFTVPLHLDAKWID
jgi:hypothetical protein